MASLKGLNIALILVQVVDVVLHVASGQLEPVRVIASALLAAWAFGLKTRSGLDGWGALAAYLLLNGFFLFQNGLTNPEQGGALRIPLFVLVLLSSLLAVGIVRARRSLAA